MELRIENENDESLVVVNGAFKYILRSCPLLQSFKLSGIIGKCIPGSSLDFCFNNGENQLLRFFWIRLYNDYYTFSDRPDRVGKHYWDFRNIKEDDKMVTGFSIDIQSTNNRVVLDLRDGDRE